MEGVLWRATKPGVVAGFISEAYWVEYRQDGMQSEFWPERDHEHSHRVTQFALILRRYVQDRTLGEALRNLHQAGYRVDPV